MLAGLLILGIGSSGWAVSVFECQDVTVSGEPPSNNCNESFSPGTSTVGEKWFLESEYREACNVTSWGAPAASTCLLWVDGSGQFVPVDSLKDPQDNEDEEFFGNLESCLANVNGEATIGNTSMPCSEFLDQQTKDGQPGDPYNICEVSASPLYHYIICSEARYFVLICAERQCSNFAAETVPAFRLHSCSLQRCDITALGLGLGLHFNYSCRPHLLCCQSGWRVPWRQAVH